MAETILACWSLGACAGLLSGLFGIGGGIILVPFLVWLFSARGQAPDSVMLLAIATSLATIIPTSLSSVASHHRRGAVDWTLVGRLAPGILIGSVAGSIMAEQMAATTLKTVFAIYLLIVALRMSLKNATARGTLTLSSPFLACAGGAIGLLSALLGIGGGTLTVPFLTRCRIPMRNAVAASAACGLPIAVSGTISYAVLGWQAERLPAGCLGYVYLPAFAAIVAGSIPLAPFGARLAHHLPTGRLKRAFAVLLAVVAMRLLWNR